MSHIPVLCDEVVSSFWHLDSKESVVLDCTLGAGGHSLALLESYPHIHIFGFDRDSSAIDIAKARLKTHKHRVRFYNTMFSQALQNIPQNLAISAILADIGVSSMQFDDAKRGFSFESEYLDMRMDTRDNLNAAKILNTYSKMRLETLWREYGEIKESKKLTNIIMEYRNKKPFSSCAELSALIARHFKRIHYHPATLAFQALRIEVNNELGELKALLESIKAYPHFAKDAKVAIISFHSLEDRIIKQYFKQWSKSCICADSVYKCECGNNHRFGRAMSKKPILPTSSEISRNPRARSAKLRVFAIDSK